MDNQARNKLLQKYLSGGCSPQEQERIEDWLENSEIKDNAWSTMKPAERAAYLLKIRTRLMLSIKPEQVRGYRLWPRIGIAAAVAVITLGIWLYEVASTRTTLSRNDDVAYENDIAPGKNMASLIIDNQGKMITLSDAKTGVIIDNDVKYNDGSVVNRGDEGKVVGMTLLIPRGGTYQMQLSDGTKVWLNADSKLEFPSKFAKNMQRIVKLTGEGYFEVAKDKLHPFIVESAGQCVTVLGTHFNISAYKGEDIKTTLLEGGVKVASSPPSTAIGEVVTLKPSQQSLITGNGGINVKEVDASQAVAWKNGDFNFKEEDLQTAMLKIARWYHVEVVYDATAPKDLELGGWVSRKRNISAVLKMIESTGKVHFKVEGRRILVTK